MHQSRIVAVRKLICSFASAVDRSFGEVVEGVIRRGVARMTAGRLEVLQCGSEGGVSEQSSNDVNWHVAVGEVDGEGVPEAMRVCSR